MAGRWPDRIYDEIARNLAMGETAQGAVAKATGRTTEEVSKFAYRTVKTPKVLAALEKWEKKLEGDTFITRDRLNVKLANMLWPPEGSHYDKNPLKASDEIAAIREAMKLNGLAPKDKAKELESKSKAAEALGSLANRLNGVAGDEGGGMKVAERV